MRHSRTRRRRCAQRFEFLRTQFVKWAQRACNDAPCSERMHEACKCKLNAKYSQHNQSRPATIATASCVPTTWPDALHVGACQKERSFGRVCHGPSVCMQLMCMLACTLHQHELQEITARVLATLDQTPRAQHVCARRVAMIIGVNPHPTQ